MFTVRSTLMWAVLTGQTDWVCHIGTLTLCTCYIIVTWWNGSGGIQAWSWQPTGFLQYFDTVGLVIWPVKMVPEMTYNVLSGTLSLYTITTAWLGVLFLCDERNCDLIAEKAKVHMVILSHCSKDEHSCLVWLWNTSLDSRNCSSLSPVSTAKPSQYVPPAIQVNSTWPSFCGLSHWMSSSESWDMNSISLVSQHKLVSNGEIWKWPSALLSVPL